METRAPARARVSLLRALVETRVFALRDAQAASIVANTFRPWRRLGFLSTPFAAHRRRRMRFDVVGGEDGLT